MEPLLDLDRLHKQYRKQKIRKIILGCIGILVVIGIGAIIISGHKPTKHVVQVYGLGGNSDSGLTPNSPSSTDKPTTPIGSTFNIPDSSTSTPNINLPSNPSIDIPSNPTNGSSSIPTPNPALCPSIKSQEQSAISSLVAQNQQLEVQLTNEDNAGETAQSQQTVNQITANSNQITSIEAPYITQLAENECSL